jgi:UDP-N-acetyl-D-mannosaminuronate dehydrogenase
LNTSERIVVVGLGEVGRPLLELLGRRFDVVGIDVDTAAPDDGAPVSVLHVCFPFEIDDFVGETVRYIERFAPRLTIIDSTVGVGSTRAVHERAGAPVVHSPIRGKHTDMSNELLRYTKYVGGLDELSADEAAAHFESAGLTTKILASPEATELAKLTETTYFGLLIAWAQDVSRYCDQVGVSYDEVVSFFEEIDFFPPVKYFPGVIGGHCVMPNIDILSGLDESDLLLAIQSSNARRLEQEVQRLAPDSAAEAPAR